MTKFKIYFLQVDIFTLLLLYRYFYFIVVISIFLHYVPVVDFIAVLKILMNNNNNNTFHVLHLCFLVCNYFCIVTHFK